MKYCADNWFLLKLFYKDEKAINILKDIEQGKSTLAIPIVTVSELFRSLFAQGKAEKLIEDFLEVILSSNKVYFLSIDINSAKQAAKNSLTFSLSLIDSYVATLAKLSDCDAILSADKDLKNLKKRKFIDVVSW